LESDRVERKESIADVKRIRQAICAFANDMPGHGRPGVVFVGVRDDGSCAHLPITDRLLLTLSNMRSDGNILPLPAWIRVGPRRAIASEEEEYRLVERRQSRHLPWDLQPLPTAEIIDLDLD